MSYGLLPLALTLSRRSLSDPYARASIMLLFYCPIIMLLSCGLFHTATTTVMSQPQRWGAVALAMIGALASVLWTGTVLHDSPLAAIMLELAGGGFLIHRGLKGLLLPSEPTSPSASRRHLTSQWLSLWGALAILPSFIAAQNASWMQCLLLASAYGAARILYDQLCHHIQRWHQRSVRLASSLTLASGSYLTGYAVVHLY